MSDDEGNVQMKVIAAFLREKGARAVHIEFNGGGDSGQIDDVTFWSGVGDREVTGVPVEITDDELQKIMAPSNDGSGAEVVDPKQAVEDWAYDILEQTGYDWCNNDGGYGTVVVDLVTNAVMVNMNINYTTSELHEIDYKL